STRRLPTGGNSLGERYRIDLARPPSSSSPWSTRLPVFRPRANQVGVLRVSLDEAGDEGAPRHHRLAVGPDLIQGCPGQPATEAVALERGVDFGVGEHDVVAPIAVLGEPGELIVDADLEALL